MASNSPRQPIAIEESVAVHYSEDPRQSSIAIHSHNYVEFSYLAEGGGIETINQQTYELRPGFFSIIHPWQTHELHFDTGRSLSYYYVVIGMDNFLGAGSVALDLKEMFLVTGSNSPSAYYFTGSDADRLRQTFQEMHTEYMTRDKWWEQAVRSKITEVLILFDRKSAGQRQGGAAAGTRSARRQTLDIIYYIYNNFKDEISLSTLSEHFGLSQNYLSTIIKASLGLAFKDFLQDVRLKYACTLLASTSMTVADVAQASGFQSYRNFGRFFQRHCKKSPTQYRAACQRPGEEHEMEQGPPIVIRKHL